MITKEAFLKRYQNDPTPIKQELTKWLKSKDYSKMATANTEELIEMGFSFRKLLFVLEFLQVNNIQEARIAQNNLIPLEKMRYFIKPNANFEETILKPYANGMTYPYFPPFELLLLCAILSLEKDLNAAKDFLLAMFSFYNNLMSYLNESDEDMVYLNDNVNPSFEMTREDAIHTISRRIQITIEVLLMVLKEANDLETTMLVIEIVKDSSYEMSEHVMSLIGRLCLSYGNFEEAEEMFESVEDSDLRNMNQGLTYFFQRDFVKAKEEFERVANPIGRVNLVITMVYLGQLKEAKKIVQELCERDPLYQAIMANKLQFLEGFMNVTTK